MNQNQHKINLYKVQMVVVIRHEVEIERSSQAEAEAVAWNDWEQQLMKVPHGDIQREENNAEFINEVNDYK